MNAPNIRLDNFLWSFRWRSQQCLLFRSWNCNHLTCNNFSKIAANVGFHYTAQTNRIPMECPDPRAAENWNPPATESRWYLVENKTFSNLHYLNSTACFPASQWNKFLSDALCPQLLPLWIASELSEHFPIKILTWSILLISGFWRMCNPCTCTHVTTNHFQLLNFCVLNPGWSFTRFHLIG